MIPVKKSSQLLDEKLAERTRQRFLSELRHHFQGWHSKVSSDFSDETFQSELQNLKRDPVYSAFGFATPEYTLIRLMGRVSISIGRRLGEIYDKVPRFAAQERFGLDSSSVAPKLGGELELDICVPLHKLTVSDRQHVSSVMSSHLKSVPIQNGLGIEIRYNFNPNDSARLRKDVRMAKLLRDDGLTGIYLIFSTISPRHEAIARLKRAGWTFLVGNPATNFMIDLVGMDFGTILGSAEIRKETESAVSRIMHAIYQSNGVRDILATYPARTTGSG
ncbi:MAG: hypothetical protein WBO19_05000 [Terriglobia bacterium]